LALSLDIQVPFFHPAVGGVETRVLTIASFLASRGHDVRVHTAAAYADHRRMAVGAENLHGFTVHRYLPEKFQGTFRVFYRPKLGPAELLETHGYPNLVGDWLVKRHGGDRATTTELIGSTLRPAKLSHRLMRAAYDATQGVPTLRRVDHIQVMTGDEEAWARKRGVQAPIDRIPNGLGEASFAQVTPEPVKAQFGLQRYVLFLGRLHAEKNPRHLVEAFARIAPSFPGLQLAFVGPDQGEAGQLRALARARGIADRVVLTGAVPDHAKIALLRGSEFLALPSSFEAQGIVLVEAWAQGRAVLASRVGGVPWLVKHGETGLLHEVGDVAGIEAGLRHLLRDPAFGEKLAKAGEAEARANYRWSVILPRMEKLYLELAARASRT
jgi:glycosyltransferase involved in cell wall biosynthesis